MKASEHLFPLALFIMLYKVALTFESVDETLDNMTPFWSPLEVKEN